jgi:hypothetical protein
MRIKQMAPDFLIVENPVSQAAGPAIICLSVDDSIDRWSVWLPAGISTASERIPIEPIPQTHLSAGVASNSGRSN